jgi:hypothetical protein
MLTIFAPALFAIVKAWLCLLCLALGTAIVARR